MQGKASRTLRLSLGSHQDHQPCWSEIRHRVSPDLAVEGIESTSFWESSKVTLQRDRVKGWKGSLKPSSQKISAIISLIPPNTHHPTLFKKLGFLWSKKGCSREGMKEWKAEKRMSPTFVCSEGVCMKVRWRWDMPKMLGRNILSQFLQTLDKISLGWAWGSGQDQGGCRGEDPGNYAKNLKQAFRDGHAQMSWEEQNKSHTLKRVSEVTGEPCKLRDQRENEDLGEVCPKIRREVVSQRLSAWTGNSDDQMLAFPLPFPCCQRCETIYSNTTPRTSLGKEEELSCVRLHSYYLRGQGLGICTSWLTPWSDVLKLCCWRLLPNMMLVEFWTNATRGSPLFKGKLGFTRTGNMWCVYSFRLIEERWHSPKHEFATHMMMRHAVFFLWHLVQQFRFKHLFLCTHS